MGKRTRGRSSPTTVNSSVRTREYLTTAEIERLMAAARKSSRYGHRDATMILIGYRHGLPRHVHKWHCLPQHSRSPFSEVV